MATTTVHPNRGAEQIKCLLASPEICDLIADLQATRWTGRPGYPVRVMAGMVLAKSLYVLPTWTRTVALVTEHASLRAAIGGCPSVDACYRFTRKQREHKALLDTAIAQVLMALREQMPDFGTNVAIDGSDLPAYANGQRFVSKGGKLRERFSDRMPLGGTVRPFPLAGVAGSTATKSTLPSARPPAFRSPGRRTLPRRMRFRLSPLCWTPYGPMGSLPPPARWTRATM